MKLQDLHNRVDQLIQLTESALTASMAPRRDSPDSTVGVLSIPAIHAVTFGQLRSGTLAFIERTFGTEHPYYREFDLKCSNSEVHRVQSALGILKAIRTDLADGWLETTRGLISAEVFSDFLEMAEHLLEEKYKDAAAVMIGSVLEEHLRQLAMSKGVPVEETRGAKTVAHKADTINADLVKSGVYEKLDQKQITAWLDLRNNAAHGHYGKYEEQQVGLMLAGVRQFIARVRP